MSELPYIAHNKEMRSQGWTREEIIWWCRFKGLIF